MDEESVKILVVDDLDYITELISKILTDAGYNVLTASSGSEAMELFLNHSPDLITIDQRLPDMTGLELAKNIRSEKRGENAKLIFITGSYEKEEIKSVLNLGPNNFLSKPFRKANLLNAVANVLNRKE